MNDRMNTFKLVERGTGRQDKASAREGIQGQDDDNAVVFMSHTRCSWVSLEKEMTPFLTEWKVLLSFSHITRSQCQRPSPLQTFRSQSEVLSPLPAGGLWLAFPVETYSVLNRKAQTSTMLSTEKMLSMLPVTTVATTEQ